MKANHLSKSFLILLLPILLFVTIVAAMQSALFIGNKPMNIAFTLDLLLTVPLVYFLLIRKTAVPKTTVVPVMILGLFLGLTFMPLEGRNYLLLFKSYALPVIECGILITVIFKVVKVIKRYKQIGKNLDFYDALSETCYEMMSPRMAHFLIMEIAVVYYGFFAWKKRQLAINEFSYHKKSGIMALYLVFIFLILTETFVFHLLLERWSVIAAWVMTAISIYSGIQIFGFVKSFAQRPSFIDNATLYLRFGIMSDASIKISNIERVELSRKTPEKSALTRTLSPLGEMEGHNVILHLKNEVNLIGLYGITKQCNVLLLFIDEPERFKEELLAKA